MTDEELIKFIGRHDPLCEVELCPGLNVSCTCGAGFAKSELARRLGFPVGIAYLASDAETKTGVA